MKVPYTLKGGYGPKNDTCGLNDEKCENDKTDMYKKGQEETFTEIKKAMYSEYMKLRYRDKITFDNANINGWVKDHFAHWKTKYQPILDEYTQKCEIFILNMLRQKMHDCIDKNMTQTDILKLYVENCEKDTT